MKFAGLILICASSCLALVLPAIGVVQFPNGTHSPAAILPPGTPTQTQLAAPVASWPPVPDTAPTGNKLGMGIWLLLVPVCLIGLTMWTFSPNPTGQ